MTPSEITFNEEGILQIKEQLWACKDLDDPYKYFKDDYGVAAASEAPNDTCHKISLKRDGKEQPPPSSHDGWNHTTTKHVTVTGYTTYCPEPTTFTVTTCVEHVCGPKPITVTEPKTVTVTEECIIPKTTTPHPKPTPTKPEETHPKETPPKETHPEETAPKETPPKETGPKETGPKETPPPKETKPSSVAGPSVSPSVSSFEGGAAQNAAGMAAGLAGFAALLI